VASEGLTTGTREYFVIRWLAVEHLITLERSGWGIDEGDFGIRSVCTAARVN
jgi:hypothetical protein